MANEKSPYCKKRNKKCPLVWFERHTMALSYFYLESLLCWFFQGKRKITRGRTIVIFVSPPLLFALLAAQTLSRSIYHNARIPY